MTKRLSWIAYRNELWRDGAELTADSEVAGWPVTNVVDLITARRWRTESYTATATATLNASRAGQVVCLSFPRITDPRLQDEVQWMIQTDTVRHRWYGTGSPPTLLYDSGTIPINVDPRYGVHAHLAPASVSGVYIVTWTVTANSRTSLGYFDQAFASWGPLFKPGNNFNFGDRLILTDPSLVSRTPVSQIALGRKQERLWGVTVSYEAVVEAERSNWIDFEIFVGTQEPFYFGLTDQGDLSQQVMLMRLTDVTGLSEQNPILSAKPVTLLEHR